jgi:DNA polymerase-3 subunit alpha
MTPSFVHLNIHTEYSISDGLIRMPALMDRLVELNMPAAAVTDAGNLFATVKFYQSAIAAGVKPIIGAELNVAQDVDLAQRTRLVALCQDGVGYRNLTRLITRSFTQAQYQGIPHVHFDWLREHGRGLLVLAGPESDIGQAIHAGRREQAKELLEAWRGAFPSRIYLEVRRLGRPGEDAYIDRAAALAARCGVPLVASNAARFLHREDFEAHEARVCIYQGRALSDSRRPRDYSEEQYLRSAEEMAALFNDLPEALENSVHIAQRCNLALSLGEASLPEFPVPAGESLDSYLRRQADAGLEQRLRSGLAPGADAGVYHKRLRGEIEVIISMGFAGYFLIVADFIRWAKQQDIPVGPGRGSGAGSLVAYALGITDLDPIRYELLFERFLNPERVSLPDFDVDFCMERRDEVIDYVAERYGRERVSQIITYGSMAAKAVVRDVGRVLGFPYGFVDQIAKLIPFDLKMTLARALDEEPRLKERYKSEEDVRAMIELAQKLEGLVRNPGRHAGGVVIAPSALTDFTALYCEQGSTATVTQFDMGDVEAVGLVKFDFLGLKTLTIIHHAVAEANRISPDDPAIDISAIPLGDAPTYELIASAETTAVFQLESRGMRDLIKRLKPDCFADLIALVALFRPGPLQSGMVDDYIERKHGRARLQYPHPDLEAILKPTNGVILYQEQVMQIAQVLAGYTLGSADLLRRAMGKKKPEEMAQQREVFVTGARENAIDERVASSIFDLMEKFAGYGFNKSHSAAYALVAYQTAWLKAHRPAAFLAAVLSADMDDTDKVAQLVRESRRMEIAVAPPDINRSAYRFTVADQSGTSIQYGLGAIKGMGASAIEAIVTEREQGGPYRDIYDLAGRVDSRKVNRRVLDALIKAGALDSTGVHRAALLAGLDQVLAWAEQHAKNRSSGQEDLFGLAPESPHKPESERVVWQQIPAWNDWERLNAEKEILGLYLSGHPMARYQDELANLTSGSLGSLSPGRTRIAGLVTALRIANSRRGRIAILELEDQSGHVDVVVYSEVLDQYGDTIAKDRILVIEGTCAMDDFSGALNVAADVVLDFEEARETFAKQLVLEVSAAQNGNGLVKELQTLLGPHCPGNCPVTLDYHHDEALARIALGGSWRVHLCDDLLDTLRQKLGNNHVRIEY